MKILGEAAGAVYQKINSCWKRNRETNKVILGSYATEEIEYLAGARWWWYEKIDGTNIRLHWNGERVLIGGRTDNAQIPGPLYAWLQDNIPYPEVWAEKFSGPVTIYGEGYGAGIQSGGAYGKPSFIVFDVKIDDWWLKWDSVCDIAHALGFDVVPFYGEASLDQAVEMVSHNQVKSYWTDVVAEGLVGRPRVELHDRRGNRIMVKVKAIDYQTEEQ